MKVLVVNATGSSKLEAMLDKDSGVITFHDGDVSHILYEKTMGKTISVLKEVKVEPKPVEEKPASEVQSKPSKPVKTKSK